jgi:hypothetical protein
MKKSKGDDEELFFFIFSKSEEHPWHPSSAATQHNIHTHTDTAPLSCEKRRRDLRGKKDIFHVVFSRLKIYIYMIRFFLFLSLFVAQSSVVLLLRSAPAQICRPEI